MIELGKSDDGRLILASNQPFPSDIARVEYFRDQKLFMLVYEDKEAGSDLMPCEMSDDVSNIIRESPDIIVIAMTKENAEPTGYQTSLVQIGM